MGLKLHTEDTDSRYARVVEEHSNSAEAKGENHGGAIRSENVGTSTRIRPTRNLPSVSPRFPGQR